MKLRAKISPKYLDQIMRGEKTWEYRQIETITLVCSDGRIAEFGVGRLDIVPVEIVAKYHPDVKWDLNKSILAMKLIKIKKGMCMNELIKPSKVMSRPLKKFLKESGPKCFNQHKHHCRKKNPTQCKKK